MSIICVPSMGDNGLDEAIGEHFGRVPTYTIVDTDSETVRVIENTSEHMGGSGYPPELLAGEGVKVMLCRGLGRRAIAMFDEMDIEVYVGAQGTVREAIDMWKEGQLIPATEDTACAQHAFRKGDHQGCKH